MMLTVKQAALRLQVSAALVYQLCAQKRIPHVRLGCGRGTIRIVETDLDGFLDEIRIDSPDRDETGPIPLKHLKMPSARPSR